MSAFVLDQSDINLLTQATCAALQLNAKYPASYHLHSDTIDVLGEYKDDLHNIYRALYITNIKAVNGRYGENTKTLPKYKPLIPWDASRLNLDRLKETCDIFKSYLYQICEDPIYGTSFYNAFWDVYKLICVLYFTKSINF